MAMVRTYRSAMQAHTRRTRCWKNRCGNNHHREADVRLRPAFRDLSSGVVFLSRFPDGRLAPMHVWDGLPESAVLHRSPDGRVASLKHTVVAGFLGGERFYTREEAAWVLLNSSPSALPMTRWQLDHRSLFCSNHPSEAMQDAAEVSALGV